jgi:hypothetical protein
MGRNKEVDAWFERYDNPMKDVVQGIRAIVLGADPRVEECINTWRVSSGTRPRSFQNPHDRNYCAPIPCRRRHTEQFVDLAKIADRFHVTTVHSKDESVF